MLLTDMKILQIKPKFFLDHLRFNLSPRYYHCFHYGVYLMFFHAIINKYMYLSKNSIVYAIFVFIDGIRWLLFHNLPFFQLHNMASRILKSLHIYYFLIPYSS